jgi:DNA end-binding protein Ku
MASRAIGSGSIAFGLVSIPVKLFPSQQSSAAIRFNRLHDTCGNRLRQQNYCPQCDAVVARDGIVKGYEFAKGQFVRLSDEELEAVEAQSTGGIDIVEFVPISRVDPVYFDKAYYLGPDKGAARAYHLLAEALRRTGLCAVAQYAARGKSYLAVLRPTADGIVLQQLYHDVEIRAFSEVELEAADVKEGELALALELIRHGTTQDFRPARYRDEVREKVQALIQAKIEGEEIISAASESPRAQVIDLMEALKASLGLEGEAEGAARKGPHGAGAPVAGEHGRAERK